MTASIRQSSNSVPSNIVSHFQMPPDASPGQFYRKTFKNIGLDDEFEELSWSYFAESQVGPATFSPISVCISLPFKMKEFAHSNSHVSRIQTSSKETAIASKVEHSVPSASVQSSFSSQFRFPQIPLTLSMKADVTVILASPESKTSRVINEVHTILALKSTIGRQ